MSAQLTAHSLTDRSYIAVGLWVCISLKVRIMSAFLALQLACHALVQALRWADAQSAVIPNV